LRTKRYILFILLSLLFRVVHAQKLNLLADTIAVCAGDSFLIKFPEDLISKSATYQWATPYKIIDHAKQLYVKQKGKYTVKIYDGSKVITDTTYVKINDKPRLVIRDTIVCSGSLITINPKTKYKYTWSTGESTEALKIDKPGKYWIKTNNKGCFYTDTFRVSSAVGTVPNFGKELLVCESDANKLLSVRAPADVKLYWNTGANTMSINATKEGFYWVKSVSKICGSKTDSVYVKYKNCDCDIYIPNSFTPNDDDRNDLFAPVFQCEYNYFIMTIFDRWGNTVYVSNNINGKWDGRFKSNPCPDDVYVYRIEAIQKNTDKKIIKNGHISLFR
jgi:gliding motility-associated-like protein